MPLKYTSCFLSIDACGCKVDYKHTQTHMHTHKHTHTHTHMHTHTHTHTLTRYTHICTWYVWLTNGATLIRKELQVLSSGTVRKWTVFHSLHHKREKLTLQVVNGKIIMYVCQYNAKLNVKFNNIILNVVLEFP